MTVKETYRCASLGGCSQPVVMTAPVALCPVHSMEVVSALLPNLLRSAAREAVALAESGDALVNNAVVVAIPGELPQKHLPVVYFIQNGSRIKIGYTTNLRGRIASLALRTSDVLMVLRGDSALEQACHRRFVRHRIGRTEWFRACSEIREYVSDRIRCDVRVPMDGVPRVPMQHKLDTGAARTMLEERLDQLKEAGSFSVRPQDFLDILPYIGRSRPWVYKRLKELADQGKLIKRGTDYRFPDETRKEAS